MPIKFFIPDLLSALTLASDIVLGLLLIYFIYRLISKNKISFMELVLNKLGSNAVVVAFMVALTATLGSLFYSEVMGFEPCKLCWMQRIFMYPLTILFGVALIRQDKGVGKYALSLSVPGALIAVYHYIIQRVEYNTKCGIDSTVQCTVKYAFDYGYITIPMMALTAFILIIILMKLKKSR